MILGHKRYTDRHLDDDRDDDDDDDDDDVAVVITAAGTTMTVTIETINYDGKTAIMVVIVTAPVWGVVTGQ